jgi:DNA-binding protein H-NS
MLAWRVGPCSAHSCVHLKWLSFSKFLLHIFIFDSPDSRILDKIGTTEAVDPMNLKSMSIDKLSKLRSQIDAALSSKVVESRRAVQGQLGKLDRLSTSGLRLKGTRGGVRGPVAPKYRNPANPGETWAGRGLKPRWLAAALKSGKKLEHFSIAASGKKIQVPKKTRKK